MASFAVDFDGVCTDLRQAPTDGRLRHHYLSAIESIVGSVPREGAIPVVSILSLFGQVEVLTHRPADHVDHVAEWLRLHFPAGVVEGVRSCNGVRKQEALSRNAILLIDDVAENVQGLGARGLQWNSETNWRVVADECVGRTVTQQGHACAHGIGHAFRGATRITNWSASPVYRLTGDDGRQWKLRVGADVSTAIRIGQLLDIAREANYPHVASLVAASGTAVIKTYLPGRPIGSQIASDDRRRDLRRVAIALARLHHIRISPVQVERLSAGCPSVGGSAPLVCSADNHNTIVTRDSIAFIDLEACRCGDPWVDVLWALECLCRSEDERTALTRAYLDAGGRWPSAAHRKAAERVYLEWLACQLDGSQRVHGEAAEIGYKFRSVQARLAEVVGATGG